MTSLMRTVPGLIAGASLVVAGVLAGVAAHAQQAPSAKRAVIVVDSSAGMLQPLETFKKYYLLRKNVQSALGGPAETLPQGVDVGLMAYGHRKRSACDDIELLSPIAAFDTRRLLQGLASVRPKGQAPVAEALKAAATALATTPNQRGGEILLIAGSPDSCHQDACETAKTLVAADPSLKINVLWFGGSASEIAVGQCVAEAGHGRLWSPTRMVEAEAVVKEAMLGLAAAPPAPLPEAALVAVVAPKKGLGLNLSAELAANSGLYDGSIAWTVRKAQAGTVGEMVATLLAPTASFELPPGSYDVEASASGIDMHQAANVVAGQPTDLLFTLNAASLELKVNLGKSETAAADLYVTLYRFNPDEDDTPQTLAVLKGPQLPMLLPAGSYRAVAARRDFKIVRDVVLTAGQAAVAQFPLASGQLQIDSTQAGGADAAYFISEDDPDQPLGLRDIARSAMPNAVCALPPGLYQVDARQGSGHARVDAVVKVGEITKVALPMAAGRLQLTMRMAANDAGSAQSDSVVTYVIERLDQANGEPRLVSRNGSGATNIELAAGRYRVTGRVGLANVSTSAEVTVQPSGDATLELKPSLGFLTLQFGDGAPPGTDLLWEIRGGDGKVVWTTAEVNPVLPLAPGDYEVHAYRANRDRSAPVSLAADERKAVVIRPE